MQKEVLKEPTYVEELLALFRSNLGKEELLEKISDYHESDIADAMDKILKGLADELGAQLRDK